MIIEENAGIEPQEIVDIDELLAALQSDDVRKNVLVEAVRAGRANEDHSRQVVKILQERGNTVLAARIAKRDGLDSAEMLYETAANAALNGGRHDIEFAAELYREAGKHEKAAEIYDALIAKEDSLYIKADLLLEKGDIEGALNAMVCSGDVEKAVGIARRRGMKDKEISILEGSEDFVAAYQAAQEAGITDRADGLFDRAIRQLVCKKDRYETKSAEYEVAAELLKERGQLRRAAGILSMVHYREKEAAELAERAGDYGLADRCYAKIDSYHGKSAKKLADGARIAKERGDAKRAKELAERAVKEFKEARDASSYVTGGSTCYGAGSDIFEAQIYRDIGDKELSDKAYGAAIAKELNGIPKTAVSDSDAGRVNRVVLYALDKGDLKLAEKIASRVDGASKKMKDGFVSLARAYEESDPSKAALFYEMAHEFEGAARTARAAGDDRRANAYATAHEIMKARN